MPISNAVVVIVEDLVVEHFIVIIVVRDASRVDSMRFATASQAAIAIARAPHTPSHSTNKGSQADCEHPPCESSTG